MTGVVPNRPARTKAKTVSISDGADRPTPLIFHVPAELDLGAMFHGPDVDYAAYLLDTLHRKLLAWDHDPRDFVPLKREYLTRYIPARRLTSIRSELEMRGVIAVDWSYSAGRRSIGYRLEPGYWESRPFECQDQAFAHRIRNRQLERQSGEVPVHRWLRRQLGRLRFDHSRAGMIILTMSPDEDSSLTEHDYHILIREMVERLRHDPIRLTADNFGRVHTPVTNLPKELRACLTVDGQHLVGLDISNSQPLFAGIVAQRYVESPNARRRMRTRRFDHRQSPYVRQEVAAIRRRWEASQGKQPADLIPNMSCAQPFDTVNAGTFAERQVILGFCPADLIKYLRLCETGQLYERLTGPGEDRDYVKKRLIIDVFFGKRCYRSALKDRFVREFPTVAAMLDSLKENNYKHAAQLMQSYEATMVIAIICDRIRKERPDVPVITIHDSILTVPGFVEYVRGVIHQQFEGIGIRPHLKEERYR